MTFIRVIRVGGSLLDWDPLGPVLRHFIDEQRPAANLVTAGGGPWVELLRDRAQALSLGAAESHWLCIRALSLTANYLSVATGYPLLADLALWRRLAPGCCVFDVEPLLRQMEPQLPGTQLPQSWDVTSDSIAARLATVVGADELVILKSCDAPASGDLSQLAELGFVDRFFPEIAGETKSFRFVNLRSHAAVGKD